MVSEQQEKIRRSQLAAIGLKQIVHSVLFLIPESPLLAISLRRLIADLLRSVRIDNTDDHKDLLECIELLLPTSVQSDSDFDATENHLLAALKIDSKLNNISIIDGIWLGFYVRLAETYVV